jgi:hypothetical protein
MYDQLIEMEQTKESPAPDAVSGKGISDKTSAPNTTSIVAQKTTQSRNKSRNSSSDRPRDNLRGKSRELPTRDEIQEFSFRLRDELKVKVQAEVPHPWQKELEEAARQLNVKKLELYRFILGEFLGKVKRKQSI